MYDAIHISDLHLGCNAAQRERAIKFLRELPETKLLVVGGDLVDSVYPKLTIEDWTVLRQLTQIPRTRPETYVVLIRGNHDWNAFELTATMGLVFREQYNYVSGYKSIFVTHGHQWDKYMNLYPTATKLWNFFNALITPFAPKLSAWLKRKRKVFCRCDDDVQAGMFAKMYTDGYHLGFAGHTHYERDVTAPNGNRYINTGSWADDVCVAAFVKDGQVEIKHY